MSLLLVLTIGDSELSSSVPEATVQTGPLFLRHHILRILLCTHAFSTDSQRPIAYASLSFNVLLAFVENDQKMMDILSKTLLQSGHVARLAIILTIFLTCGLNI